MRKPAGQPRLTSKTDGDEPAPLRIIGGRCGDASWLYSGHERTRPMKDRVREAVFNLVGPDVSGMHALDLFAGTGALGLEAISRGAGGPRSSSNIFPPPTWCARTPKTWAWPSRCQVEAGEHIHLGAGDMPRPAIFPGSFSVRPPFAFYVERQAEMLALVETLSSAPPRRAAFSSSKPTSGSTWACCPRRRGWDVRRYPPAIVAINHRP